MNSELLLVVNLNILSTVVYRCLPIYRYNCQVYRLYRSLQVYRLYRSLQVYRLYRSLQVYRLYRSLQVYRLCSSTDSTVLQTLQNSTDDCQVYRLYNKFLSLLM
jgi:hypothetical protein